MLIVANKYQTGFDQPLLCAMYVDKRLAGIQAVQTLSRLNRTCPGKEETFVLDFVNEREAILASFQDYYETTTTADEVDPQRLYELEHELDEFQLYTPSEVDGFAAIFFKLQGQRSVADSAPLNAWLDPAVDRFKALKAGDDDEAGQERQEEFRGKLTAFKNLYGFLGQIVPFADPDLEKLYAFGRMLLRKLPRPDSGGPVDLGDDVVLASFKLKLEAEGALGPEVGRGRRAAGSRGHRHRQGQDAEGAALDHHRGHQHALRHRLRRPGPGGRRHRSARRRRGPAAGRPGQRQGQLLGPLPARPWTTPW